MWWPIEIKLRGSPSPPPLPQPASLSPAPSPPAPSPPAPSPPAPLLADRPATVIGLLSDLCRDPRQAGTFLMISFGLLLAATFCVVGACVVVNLAAKGIKGIPLRYAVWGGFSGASLLTLVTTLVARRIRKMLGTSRANATSDGTQGGRT